MPRLCLQVARSLWLARRQGQEPQPQQETQQEQGAQPQQVACPLAVTRHGGGRAALHLPHLLPP